MLELILAAKKVEQHFYGLTHIDIFFVDIQRMDLSVIRNGKGCRQGTATCEHSDVKNLKTAKL